MYTKYIYPIWYNPNIDFIFKQAHRGSFFMK